MVWLRDDAWFRSLATSCKLNLSLDLKSSPSSGDVQFSESDYLCLHRPSGPRARVCSLQYSASGDPSSFLKVMAEPHPQTQNIGIAKFEGKAVQTGTDRLYSGNPTVKEFLEESADCLLWIRLWQAKGSASTWQAPAATRPKRSAEGLDIEGSGQVTQQTTPLVPPWGRRGGTCDFGTGGRRNASFRPASAPQDLPS
jgi:hypothetical protein